MFEPRVFGCSIVCMLAMQGEQARELPLCERRDHTGFGSSVAAAGDVDHDGVPDLIVGDPGGSSTDAARLWVLSGKSGTVLHSVELPRAYDLIQPMLFDAGPDIDGDHVPDVVVPLNKPSAAADLCWFSGATGRELHHASSRRYGSSRISAIRFVPDLDRDGIEDVAVLFSNTSAKHGTIAIYSSRTGKWLREISIDNERETYCAAFDAIGDVDADGVTDVAVLLDPYPMNQDANSRRIPVADADRKCVTSLRAYSLGDGHRLWEKSWRTKLFVHDRVAVTRLGPLNGASRLVAGFDEHVEVVESRSGDTVFEYERDHNEMYGFGCAVASPGDIDGDQVPDFIYGVFDTSVYDGRVTARSGQDGHELWHYGEGGTGDDDVHHRGYQLAVLGDLDGDGIADLAVASEMRINNTSGAAEVVSGKTGKLLYRFRRSDHGVVVTRSALVNETPDGKPLRPSAGEKPR
jgi:WD40 repeat protein